MAERGVTPTQEGRSPMVWALLAVVVALLIFTRFFNLGYQAFHHDESIHCLFAWKVWQEGPSSYRYDPVYHGPFLFHYASLFHFFLPDTDAMARVPFALIGALLVPVWILLRRVVGWGTVLLLMALLTLSPILNYYSRFARNDAFMTAWLTGMIVFGYLYLRTCRVRHLTVAAVCLALSYCTKENSYVNNFGLCSFLIGWGVVRACRNFRGTMEEIFVRYLPLTRVLVLFGCLSVMAFSYVAIDSRVGPETGLAQGISRIITHSTSVSAQTDASVFAGQSGYFTAPGREGIRSQFFTFGIGATILFLLIAEGLSLWLSLCRSRIRFILLLGGAVTFYLCLLNVVLPSPWLQDFSAQEFARTLMTRLPIELAVLFLVAGIFAVADFAAASISVRAVRPLSWMGSASDSATLASGFAGRLRLWYPWILQLWGLAVQVVLVQAIYLTLFSSVGTNAKDGIVGGSYDYLSYWFRHQTGDYRIWGPWWYYVTRLVLYEMTPILLIVVAVCLLAREWLAGKGRPDSANGRRPKQPKKASAAAPADAGLAESNDGLWLPVPLPLLFLSGYLALYMIAIYALLNEKVAWLATYQAFGLSLFAALLCGHWMATRKRAVSTGRGEVAARVAMTLALCAMLAYTIGQHVAGVFVRPDYPSEIINYTATTHDFAEQIRKIQGMARERISRGEPKLRIALEGTAEWPCAWYFRNDDVAWKTIDLTRDVQIMDDTAENLRRVERRRDKVWKVEGVPVRGWWIWHGDTRGLPGGKSIWKNLLAFLNNSSNDLRETFPEAIRPAESDYPIGFAAQVLKYVFTRTIWYPTAGSRVLVCYKTSQEAPVQARQAGLEGADGAARPLNAESSFGSKGSGPGQYLEPRGIAFTPKGEVVVADSKNGRIQVVSPKGESLLEFGKGVLSAEVSGACGVACDAEGNFFVADTWNHAVRKFSAEGKLKATAQQAMQGQERVGLFGPRGIAVNSRGAVFVTDTGNKFVRVYSSNLEPLSSWGGTGDAAGEFNEPVGIAIDKSDRVYVADAGNGRIQRFSSEGKFDAEYETIRPREGELVSMEPNVAVTSEGRIAVTYPTTGTFWLIDPEKRAVTIWRIESPLIRAPYGVAANADGSLWIADRESSVLAKVRPR